MLKGRLTHLAPKQGKNGKAAALDPRLTVNNGKNEKVDCKNARLGMPKKPFSHGSLLTFFQTAQHAQT